MKNRYLLSVTFLIRTSSLFAMDVDTIKISEPTILAEHMDYIGSTAVSPDGALIAVGTKGAVILYDVRSGKYIKTLHGHVRNVMKMAFNQKSTLLAVGSDDGVVVIWDIKSGKYLHFLSTFHCLGDFGPIAFSPDETKIALGCKSYNRDKILVILWDINTGQYLETSAGHEETVTSVTFSPDGRKIASGSCDKTIKICDVETGNCLKTLRGHKETVRSVVFSPDGTQLISGSRDCSIKFWDVWTGKCIKTHNDSLGSIDSMVLNHDSKLIAFVNGYAIRILDVDSGKCLKSFFLHVGSEFSIAFSHDGTLVVSESIDRLIAHEWDNTVTLWTITSGNSSSVNNSSYCTVL